MIDVPPEFLSCSYNPDRYPGAPGVAGLSGGANCQLFAYELLRHFGKQVPDFRSSDLWEDETHTVRVQTFEPLDLLMFNSDERSWGAHIGVYLGDNKVIHLSQAVGHPVVWQVGEFANHESYQHFIGAKRVVSEGEHAPRKGRVEASAAKCDK